MRSTFLNSIIMSLTVQSITPNKLMFDMQAKEQDILVAEATTDELQAPIDGNSIENISKDTSDETIFKSKSKKKKNSKKKQVQEQEKSTGITTTMPTNPTVNQASSQLKPQKPRPNFFIGFRIREESIIEKLSTLQDEIREKCPDIATCLIKPHTFHVTLMVMNLADEEAIEDAREILRTNGPEFIREAFPDGPPSFEFQGYEFFGQNNVLHTGPDMESKDVENLTTLVRLLYGAYQENGFVTEKLKCPYRPHLTIWKASKDPKRIFRLNKGKKKDEYVQQALVELMAQKSNPSPLIFGTEQPLSVELLSMTEKDADGYYKEHASLSLVSSAEPPSSPLIVSQTSISTEQTIMIEQADFNSTETNHIQLSTKTVVIQATCIMNTDAEDEHFRPLPQRIRRCQR